MISYILSGDDRIRWIEGDWDGFAERNGAAELTAAAVLGAPLWDFVAGEHTRQLLADLFARVRSSSSAVSLPFRCDSPERRRHMRMHVHPLDDGSLRIDSVLLVETPRPPVLLLELGATRAGPLLTLCSWCKRARLDTIGWVEIEEAIERLGLFEPPVPPLTHGICEDCMAAALNDLPAPPLPPPAVPR